MEAKLKNWKITAYHWNFRLYRSGWMIACKPDGEKLWLERIHRHRWGRLSFLIK